MVNGPNPPGAAGEAYRRKPTTLSKMYRPSKKPRKICALFVCCHSPPALIVWAPVTNDTLFLTWNRFTSSSMFGPRKNGLPNRKDGAKPIAVSAGTDEDTAERGRLSREYVT